jgi:hypothetical protein
MARRTGTVKSIDSGFTNAAEMDSNREQLSRLAYTLWQARGCPDGSPDEDWLKAEQELRNSLQVHAPNG